MKHNIRQKILDPVRGVVTKVVTIDGELGSGVLDKNGNEIFEGDRVKMPDGKIRMVVPPSAGGMSLFEKDTDDDETVETLEEHTSYYWFPNDDDNKLRRADGLEVVGHVDERSES